MNRWKDLFTGKGPDIFIENGYKAADGRSYRIPCYGWEELEYDNSPWKRQRETIFDSVRPRDSMDYDFRRRKYCKNPQGHEWSKLLMRDDMPPAFSYARTATGDLIRFDRHGNGVSGFGGDGDRNAVIHDVFNHHAVDFSDWLYEHEPVIQDQGIRRGVESMHDRDRRYV